MIDIRTTPPTHRDFDKKGILFKKYWIYDDIKIEIFYKTEKPTTEHHYKKNAYHRDNDLPAYIEYFDYETDKRHVEHYCIEGKFYRENDKPSYIEYDINGKIKEQRWIIGTILNREFGPALINEEKEKWYLNGNNITNTVMEIIFDLNLPLKYENWTNDHKILFKLRHNPNK